MMSHLKDLLTNTNWVSFSHYSMFSKYLGICSTFIKYQIYRVGQKLPTLNLFEILTLQINLSMFSTIQNDNTDFLSFEQN